MCLVVKEIQGDDAHMRWLFDIAFNPEETLLTMGSADETIKIWDSTIGQCTPVLRRDRPYERINLIGTAGLTDAQRKNFKTLGAMTE